MSRVFSFLKRIFEVCANPIRASELLNGWGAPALIVVLSGMLFFWPLAFFIASYYTAGLFMIVPLGILGIPLMALFWVYSWAVFYALTRAFDRSIEAKGLLKLVGICLAPVLLAGLVNIFVALMFFRSPLVPNFIVMLLSLGYFVYCVVKNLQAKLNSYAFVVGFLYVVISLALWFVVKV